MLTWQDNTPRFAVKGFTGDQMILYFGSTYIDDIEISEFHLEIQLLEYDGKWAINTPWTQLSEGSREFPAHTDKFLSELKLAIERKHEFEFSEYLRDWQKIDAKFSVVIINTGKESRRII